jgi:hypothetical protein
MTRVEELLFDEELAHVIPCQYFLADAREEFLE